MSLLGGRYRLEEPLGAGGMARVVAATDELLHRRVAVKLLHDGTAADPLVRERLLREARAAASLSHPNAVAVFDTGEDDGTPFIVMELVQGRTLADRLRDDAALPVDEALTIADEILAALAAAHGRGLVHRDVKPANVLLPDDGSGAKLGDFGIAKGLSEAGSGLTATGQVLGTPRYLSPEQVQGTAATAQSDLYAVGILCYELLAGVRPFDAQEPVAIALAHLNTAPVPLAEHRADLPSHVTDAVARALEKAPADRFADAAAMRAALRGRLPATPPTAAAAPTVPVAAAAAQTQAHAATEVLAPTRDLVTEPVSRPRRGAPAGMWVVGAIVAVVLLTGVGMGLTGSDGAQEAAAPLATEPAVPAVTPDPVALDEEPQPPELPEVEEPAAAEPGSEQAPEPDPQPEVERVQGTDRAPESPQELLALLEADPDAAGEKGDDLRKKLADVLDEKPKDQPKKARELIEESAEWAEDGDLDPRVAGFVAELLEPLASGQGEGRGGRGTSGPPPGPRS